MLQYGYENYEEDEEDSFEDIQFFYAKLNKEVEKNNYTGIPTDQTDTIIDNRENTIKVQLKNTPKVHTNILDVPTREGDILVYNQNIYISVPANGVYAWQLFTNVAKFG